jgi:hypothetical protein
MSNKNALVFLQEEPMHMTFAKTEKKGEAYTSFSLWIVGDTLVRMKFLPILVYYQKVDSVALSVVSNRL